VRRVSLALAPSFHPVPKTNRCGVGRALEGTARELMAVEQPDDSGDALEDAEAFLLNIPVLDRKLRDAKIDLPTRG
jgi:hypothetical protein